MEDRDQQGNDEQGQKIMWFTTTLSTHMEGKGGASMFPGLYECTLDIDRINENPILRDSPSAHLLLNIDNILVKEHWM